MLSAFWALAQPRAAMPRLLLPLGDVVFTYAGALRRKGADECELFSSMAQTERLEPTAIMMSVGGCLHLLSIALDGFRLLETNLGQYLTSDSPPPLRSTISRHTLAGGLRRKGADECGLLSFRAQAGLLEPMGVTAIMSGRGNLHSCLQWEAGRNERLECS